MSDGQVEARELPGRYLPLDRRRAALFLDDWEATVRGQLRRLRAEEEAVLYRVFDRALGALPRFRGESRISTWLYRITYREALRHLERTKRLSLREAPLEAAAALPADDDLDPERMLEHRENGAAVARALDLLDPRDRELLALRYLEDLKLQELADRLDMPLGTVKVRIHRALKLLRRELDADA
ncbi:MAG: sigma-70 family RNA polymerase sigma factor [Candidatus Krumholzibacteriia bacterium]|nr:sigma-70 family RNA polymerase sigma factor [Verrucomicrobiales bacterium]